MKFILLVFLLLVAGLLLAKVIIREDEVILQPIRFNHELHTGQLQMECTECHKYVKEAEFAGRPSLVICAACHEEALTESPEEKKLVELVLASREIPWQRLDKVPSHVYFSHRRHVTATQIECVTCHGEIGHSSSPPEKPLIRLRMNFCLECHEKEKASVDCNSCHR